MPAEAANARSALAKGMYSRLFDWTLRKVNGALATGGQSRAKRDAKTHFIGLLDIFGFESFGHNSLEQLLINLANERLQQHFNAFVFKSEAREYAAEGVPVTAVDFVDNVEVLQLLEKKPQGVLPMLNEECTRRGGSDEQLLKKYFSTHGGGGGGADGVVGRLTISTRGSSKMSDKEKKAVEPSFGIVHYAGHVVYDVTNFVDKNRDALPDAVAALVCKSTDSFVANLLFGREAAARAGSAAAAAASRPRRRPRRRPRHARPRQRRGRRRSPRASPTRSSSSRACSTRPRRASCAASSRTSSSRR